MSSLNNGNPGHDEIFLMLPWYINQTLEPSVKESVSRHVDICDECQREIQLLISLNEAVESDASSHYRTHADVGKNLASVMIKIDTEATQSSAVESWISSLNQKLEKVFSFSSSLSNAQWGATALAGLLVAVLGFQVYYGQPENNYSVLSSSDIEDSSMRLSVEITAAADREQAQSVIQDELDSLGRPTDIETTADGMFIIKFKDNVGVDELKNIINDLENEVQIERAILLP